MDAEESVELTAEEFLRNRRLKLLLIIGVCLNAFVVFNSDLGLDTHIHLTYATNEEIHGEAILDWGHTRPIDSTASDPSYTPTKDNGWYNFIGDSSMDVRLFSFAVTLGFIAILYKNDLQELATIVAIYPAFIFSTGRGYPEVFLAAMLFAVVILISRASREERRLNRQLQSLAIAVPMAAVVYAKGIDMQWGLPFGLAALLWFEIANRNDSLKARMSNPIQVLTGFGVSIALGMFLIGIFEMNSTLSIIAEQPSRFASAMLFAILDVVVIYALFGMVLWPFIGSAIKGLKQANDLETATLTGMIVAFSVAITIYVAALWTYESTLWNADWPWMILTMGNNGRYISLMLIPAFMLLRRMNEIGLDVECLESPGEKYHHLVIGVALILPLSLLASIHAQTMWTDDAADTLNSGLEDGEDFLFVHDATLGMHYLYTFHTAIEDVHKRNITGHWRSPDSGWEQELYSNEEIENRGNLSDVGWIVISPNIEWAPLQGWSLASEGDADFLNGGGTWKVYTTHVATNLL